MHLQYRQNVIFPSMLYRPVCEMKVEDMHVLHTYKSSAPHQDALYHTRPYVLMSKLSKSTGNAGHMCIPERDSPIRVTTFVRMKTSLETRTTVGIQLFTPFEYEGRQEGVYHSLIFLPAPWLGLLSLHIIVYLPSF